MPKFQMQNDFNEQIGGIWRGKHHPWSVKVGQSQGNQEQKDFLGLHVMLQVKNSYLKTMLIYTAFKKISVLISFVCCKKIV